MELLFYKVLLREKMGHPKVSYSCNDGEIFTCANLVEGDDLSDESEMFFNIISMSESIGP